MFPQCLVGTKADPTEGAGAQRYSNSKSSRSIDGNVRTGIFPIKFVGERWRSSLRKEKLTAQKPLVVK